ncbi:MAG: metal ABC transporter solute-binding protein, Zn/Mn family [Stellaceae bacterium]
MHRLIVVWLIVVWLIVVWLVASLTGVATAGAAPLTIVAAENFYGDIARQIGGGAVAVTSILSNPDQDPHEFEASPSTARAFAAARLVVYNGAGYDPWALKLLAASSSASRQTVIVATLVHKKAGDNPHLWYEPGTMPVLAATLAERFAKLDPAHRADYVRRLASFRGSIKPLDDAIAALRRKYAGTAVAATEPVFGYMAAALGLDMRDRRFQLAVMNDTEPSAADIAEFEKDLRSRTVKVLIYNSQTSEALTRRMRMIAIAAGVPVIGVSETEPRGKDYQEWMLSQLQALDRALAH